MATRAYIADGTGVRTWLFYGAFYTRHTNKSVNFCAFILQPDLQNGKISGGFTSGFSVVTSSTNAKDGYSKSGQMDWLIHRGEGNAISLNDKPSNELMTCDRRREEWGRIDNLWGTDSKRRTLEIVTDGKNAWSGMNNTALSTFFASFSHTRAHGDSTMAVIERTERHQTWFLQTLTSIFRH